MSQHLPPESAASDGCETAPRDVLARRRFVRGVFAAPAIMTVCSGSAYAAAVSATCLTKAQDLPEPFVNPIGGTDTWLRVFIYVDGNGNANAKQYVSYDDLRNFGGSQGLSLPPIYNPVPVSGDFLELDSSGALTGGVKAGPLTLTSNAVIVRVDGGRYVVGTGIGDTLPGAATSFNCWSSVRPFP